MTACSELMHPLTRMPVANYSVFNTYFSSYSMEWIPSHWLTSERMPILNLHLFNQRGWLRTYSHWQQQPYRNWILKDTEENRDRGLFLHYFYLTCASVWTMLDFFFNSVLKTIFRQDIWNRPNATGLQRVLYNMVFVCCLFMRLTIPSFSTDWY